ncbi:phospholipase D-like domain-containing protein [Galactobacter valiniphilus]|uniref:hypothetical protein n=1 Tax=Galactobacter valiniphilus TaxID=2676122 RepID=UPI003734DD83
MVSPGEVSETIGSWLESALREPDGPAHFASPYLAYDVCRTLSEAAERSRQPFVLLTVLDPSAVANGYVSAQGLRRLVSSGVLVRHVERLHAKCFIVGSAGALGSANLTGAGLGSSVSPNRELAVVLTPEQAESARRLMLGWPSRLVNASELDELETSAARLGRRYKLQHDPLDADTALHLAESLLTDARDGERRLWLKLEYGEPALDGWRADSWFASPKKGKPGFRAGDLVFICAKDTKDCYAVVEVTGESQFQPAFYREWTESNDPEAFSRWPWTTSTTPRLVPNRLLELKLSEMGVSGQALQNGHVRLKLDQFTAGVRALARLSTD